MISWSSLPLLMAAPFASLKWLRGCSGQSKVILESFTWTTCQTYWRVSGLHTPSAPPSSPPWGLALAPPHDQWWGWYWNKQDRSLMHVCQQIPTSPAPENKTKQNTHKGFADLYSSVSESSSSEYWVSPLPPARRPRATRSPAAFPYPVYFNRLSTTRGNHSVR